MASPPAAISAYYRLAGNAAGPFPWQWAIIDFPLQLSFDGVSPHLSIVPPQFGQGFDVATSPGAPTTVNLDTSSVPFRVPAPTAPGPAVDPVTGLPYGTGAYAVDISGRYDCAEDPTNPGQFVWVKSAASPSW